MKKSYAKIVITTLLLTQVVGHAEPTEAERKAAEDAITEFVQTLTAGESVHTTLTKQLVKIENAARAASDLQADIDRLQGEAKALQDDAINQQPIPQGQGNQSPQGPSAEGGGPKGDGEIPEMGKNDPISPVDFGQGPSEVAPLASQTGGRGSVPFQDIPISRPDLSGLLPSQAPIDSRPFSAANVAANGLAGNVSSPNAAGGGGNQAQTAPGGGAAAPTGPAMGGAVGGGGSNVGGDPQISPPDMGGSDAAPRTYAYEAGNSSGGEGSGSTGGNSDVTGTSLADVRAQIVNGSPLNGRGGDLASASERKGIFQNGVGEMCASDKGKSKIALCGLKRDPIVLALTDVETEKLLKRPVFRGLASSPETAVRWTPKSSSVGDADLLQMLRSEYQ